MLSYDVTEHGKPLQARLRETPAPKGSEVVVRITHCGVCHSDVHLWHGYFDLGAGRRAYLKDRGLVPPLTLGHEPLGVVEAIGPDVKDVRVGDKRVVYPWIGCGACRACDEGFAATSACMAASWRCPCRPSRSVPSRSSARSSEPWRICMAWSSWPAAASSRRRPSP
ncbi:L-threonine 3-dehydrogenase [compost metagenome]